MCGIYGFIGKPDKRTPEAIRELAIMNISRGTDSTGLVIASNKSVQMFKKPVNSLKFMGKNTVKELLSSYSCSKSLVIIGHTRLATKGSVNEDNAHPWKIGRYFFAHNGIISNFDSLEDEFGTNYQVDSQIIGHLLNIQEPKRLFSKTLKGSYAVPYFNEKEPQKLYIAKHSSPLSVAVTKHGAYFSSEFRHLELVMKNLMIDCDIYMVPDDRIITLDFTSGKLVKSHKDLDMPEPIVRSYGFDDYYNSKYKKDKFFKESAWKKPQTGVKALPWVSSMD